MLKSAHRTRAGFTLVELLVTLVLLAIVLGALTTTLVRQQGFYRSAEGVMDARGQLRQAIAVLPAELRGISASASDVYAMSDHMIEFRSTMGSSIMCRLDSSTAFVVPPVTLNRNNGLTSWLTQPVAGDSMMVFDEGATTASTDDTWRVYSILAITAVTGTGAGGGCTVASGFVQGTDTTRSSYRIRLAAGTPLSGTIVVGAPIRFFRRVRYELFQETDNNWYLGYYDCLAGRSPTCNAMEAISGPYLPYVSATSTGLLLNYYDSTGTALSASIANAPNISRIELKTFAQTKQANLTGAAVSAKTDSLIMSIGLRNRR